MTRKRNKKKSSSGSWEWTHVHLSFFLLAISFVLSLFIGSVLYLLMALDIPDISSIGSYNPPVPSVILDNRGEVVAEFYRERRYVVPVSKMPELLPKAFVAAEDGRFYQHGGVDGWSVLRALINNIRSGRRAQGGSTITQQVARSLLLSPEKTYARKIREAILAYRIDRFLDKDSVLHLYLNQIYLGEGAYGVEAAARTYFGKHTSELNLAEICLLAGLPQAPSRYSPFDNFKLAKGRQRYVLNRMAADGYITPEEARRAYRRVLRWKQDEKAGSGAARHFVEHVRRLLDDKYGRDKVLTEGLVIHTTMDSKLQEEAAKAVDRGLVAWQRRNRAGAKTPQGALVAIEPGSSRVVAMVGGTDFASSQYNRAVQAKRQPGSAFKPLIYAAAFKRTVTPADIILDEPLKLQGAGAGDYWQPQNFSGKFHGKTTVRDGLVHSLNIVTIKLLQRVGVDSVKKLAVRMGITAPLSDNLSLALGSSGISLLELTNAYNVFAGSGMFREPVFIEKVLDRRGRLLEMGAEQNARRVLSPRDAYLVTDLLKGVISEGTGKSARGLSVAAAGKTGTSDQNMDAWFVGYTPEMVAGVWFGFDQNIPLGPSETGGRAAAPVWRYFMGKTVKNNPAGRVKFPIPADVVFLPMDRKSGEVRREETKSTVLTAFKKDMLPAAR